jgi:hypothetical protein
MCLLYVKGIYPFIHSLDRIARGHEKEFERFGRLLVLLLVRVDLTTGVPCSHQVGYW